MGKPNNYYQGVNQYLLKEVPEQAKRILEIGCASGYFGKVLKQIDPERYVVGIEYVPEVAEVAQLHLDEVYCFDIQKHDMPEHLEPASFDCLVCGDVLEHLTEATAVLKKMLPYLKDDACVVACIPNAQHWTVLQQLLTQNFQYHDAGLLDKTHVNLMTLPNMFKMFLDAGYIPKLKQIIAFSNADQEFINSLQPALNYLGVSEKNMNQALNAFQYILVAKVNQSKRHFLQQAVQQEQPCTVIAAVNNDLQLRNNLLVSHDLNSAATKHQMLIVKAASSMDEVWQKGLAMAQHDWIVLVHQDVYLPEGWFSQIQYAWHEAEEKLGQRLGMVGVVGLLEGEEFTMAGHVIDRTNTFNDHVESLPKLASSLDELVLVFRKDRWLAPISSQVGFHFYGTDLLLKAQTAGFAAAIVDVPCFHNSSRHFAAHHQDEDLKAKAVEFYWVWEKRLPISTMVASFNPNNITFH